VGNLAFNGGVKVAEGGSSLGRLAQYVAPAEAGEVVRRIMKPKLMNRAVGPEQLKLSMFEL
jgi:hypothetical protein